MIKIVCVGKIKEKFYIDAIDEYMKRMQKYHKVVIEEVIDSNPKNEGDLILKRIQDKDYVIVMDILGKEMDSLEFSNYDCSRYISELMGDKTKCVVLAHLSEENNTPELAYDTLMERLTDDKRVIPDKIIIAKQNKETELINIKFQSK